MNRKILIAALLSTLLLIPGTAQACAPASLERSDHSRADSAIAFRKARLWRHDHDQRLAGEAAPQLPGLLPRHEPA